MESIWRDRVQLPQFPQLRGDISTDVLVIGGGWAELEAFAKLHYPDGSIVSRWAAQDCMSLDGLPYIGQYSAATGDLPKK